MGLFSFLKGQFIEVIEWVEDTDSIVYRFPAYDNAIKMGAQLTVREGQAAIFLNEGTIADVFGPGRYELSTQNMPVLTALKAWKHAFNSPFKADVYFVNTTTITDQKWGTTNPIIMRDKEIGVIRARGFGNYSFRVTDPAVFMEGIFGAKQEFHPEQIGGFFKTMIVSGVSDLLAESSVSVIDLATQYDELSVQAAAKLQPNFSAIGLELTALVIENISLPAEVETMIDRRSSMNIAGNLDQYVKFQSAEAIRDAAQHGGDGLAGAGVGLGAGLAMGQLFSQSIAGAAQPGSEAEAKAAVQAAKEAKEAVPAEQEQGGGTAPTVPCGGCGHPLGEKDKFCSECGIARPERSFCPECGTAQRTGVKFCTSCGTKM
ncbi:SPFH domain-containing protein [Paenibacillus sp. OV219]|uniref:SPFH domain-containing protein n=1 Tax=Paenibacillus sp. OV219 TaxID=1884377 RepID=UPI0008CBD985|nr:SPFH domain-containing protein [Paenibacillus sp. OV219]SEN54854.1 Membrane protease subunit, stomatin/prohibitin family, contains C-terminal Zn-ribbon domain [Paenibacillus sp. OV219]